MRPNLIHVRDWNCASTSGELELNGLGFVHGFSRRVECHGGPGHDAQYGVQQLAHFPTVQGSPMGEPPLV